MAKVRQPYADTRRVPWLNDREVAPGEVVVVPDAELAHWLEAGWQPADGPTTSKGRQLAADGTITVLNVPEQPATDTQQGAEGKGKVQP